MWAALPILALVWACDAGPDVVRLQIGKLHIWPALNISFSTTERGNLAGLCTCCQSDFSPFNPESSQISPKLHVRPHKLSGVIESPKTATQGNLHYSCFGDRVRSSILTCWPPLLVKPVKCDTMAFHRVAVESAAAVVTRNVGRCRA